MKLSVLSLAAIAASCATAAPFVVTGESLKVLGGQFVVTSELMNAAMLEGRVSRAQYEAWRDFGIRFQVSYPAAVDAWELARHANDAAMEKKYAALIAQLAVDLGVFYADAKAAVAVLKPAPPADGGS